MRKTIFFVLCLIAYTTSAQKPELVLPTIHSDYIRGKSFSADGKYLVTSAANEIKLWETASGRLIRTIISPVPIDAIALSSDGTRLVSGSFCGASEYDESQGLKPDLPTDVRVWDMVSGKQLRILKAFGKPLRISQVDISLDGQYALAGHEGNITVWETSSGAEKAVIQEDGLVSFSYDGKHLLLNQRNSLKWYHWGNRTTDMILSESCAFAQCTPKMVVVITDSGHVKRWDISGKTIIKDLETDFNLDRGREFNQFPGQSLSFSTDGSLLGIFHKTTLDDDEVSCDFKVMDTQSGAILQDSKWKDLTGDFFWLSPDLRNLITKPQVDVADVRSGMRAYSTKSGRFSHCFGMISLEETTHLNQFSPYKYQVYNEGELLFIDRSEAPGMEVNTAFLPGTGNIFTGIEPGSPKNYVAGKTLQEDSRWSITCKDRLSYQLTDTRSGQVVANLLLAEKAPDYLDEKQTVSRSNIWAVTTPSGIFDASPEMMKSLHYVVGMEVIELDQLKARYWQPGLLQMILSQKNEKLRNVSAFDSIALQPLIQATLEKNILRIKLTERSGGIGKLSLYINKYKEIAADINPKRLKTLTINLDDYYNAEETETIGLVVYDANNWLKSQTYELPYKPVGAKGEISGESERFDCGAQNPKLFLLMVGTSKYSDASKSLTYPDLDAAEMAKALGSAGKALFKDNVQLKLLSTAGGEVEESNRINIEKAFSDFAQKATPCDVLVVFFSGHGTTWGKEGDKPNFFYLTKDITSTQLADDQVRNAYAVSDEDLKKWLVAIKARKQVLILDACNSGQAVENLSGIGQRDLNASQVIAFDILKDRTGTFILSGSASDMLSYEAAEYGQGLLTYSLLEGISGTALKGNQVDIMVLFQNSRDVVPKLAQGIKRVQIPVISAPFEAASFPIGIKDSTVQIVLPQRKPVVIQCNFQDKVDYKDGLGLSQALNGYFQDQSAKGVQAKYVFYNISEYAEGFSIWGNYTIQGNQVIVGGRLFKGDKPVGKPFQLTGTKDPATLVKLILKEVGPRISIK